MQSKLNPFNDSPENLSESDKDRLKIIIAFVAEMKKYVISLLQDKPLQYVVNNYKDYCIDYADLPKLNDEIIKYGTIFPGAMRKLSTSDIYKSYNGKNSFDALICSILNEMITCFKNIDSIDEKFKNDPKSYRDILNYAVHMLKNEAEAYQINSDLNKYSKNISNSISTLNDLIPMTYNAVVDELSSLLNIINDACKSEDVSVKDIESLIYNFARKI